MADDSLEMTVGDNSLELEVNPPYVGSAFSPEVDIEETESTITVTITDARGEHSYSVSNPESAIADAEAATTAANAAASSANSAASAATTAKNNANAAASAATSAASAASDAADLAEEKAGVAVQAASDAVSAAEVASAKATLANTAATAANAAASAAGNAASAAISAADYADTATRDASAAADAANSAAGAANAAAAAAESATTTVDAAVSSANSAAAYANNKGGAAANAASAANDAATAANTWAERAQAAAEAAEGIVMDDIPLMSANIRGGAKLGSGMNIVDGALYSNASSYNTVAAMQADTTLIAGMICHTLGFHSAGDGGAAWYRISNTGTANGMDILACENGLFAVLNVNDYVTPEMFGAYGDGEHDDTIALQHSLSFKKISLLDKDYKITSTLYVDSDTTITGCGKRKSYIACSDDITAISFKTPEIETSTYGIVLKDFGIKNDAYSGIGITHDGASSNIVLQNLLINGFATGVQFNSIWASKIEVVQCFNCAKGFELSSENGGISTSTSFISCYVNNCEYGYYFNNLMYSSLISCACDNASQSAYYFFTCRIAIIYCGCERPYTAITVHSYSSVILINGFTCAYAENPDGLIITDQTTQNQERRTKIHIDGLRAMFSNTVFDTPSKAADIKGCIKASGDIQIHIENFWCDDIQGITPPQVSGFLGHFIKMDANRNQYREEDLPIKGMVFDGSIFIKRQGTSTDSIGWIIGRTGACYKEAYDATHSYVVGDQVSSGAKVYVCIQNHTGSGTSNLTDTDYWKIYGTDYDGNAKASCVIKALPNTV